MSFYAHPTSMIEEDVEIGDGTRIWDNVHIRRSTRIGSDCIVGEKAHVSYQVRIGNRVKINAFAYLCTGVELADGVMVSAGAIFTNDRFPRAATADLRQLRSSEPDEKTEKTFVGEGATIGAGAVIGPGVTIGRFAMIGMGSVVTRDIPDFYLSFGNPARLRGIVCRCGQMLCAFEAGATAKGIRQHCTDCGRGYVVPNAGGAVYEMECS